MLLIGQHGDAQMPFGFDRRKAIQAVAYLLKTRPNSTDNYMRLLKILYMADRESLIETGAPITGDRFVSMPHGTMLSRLLNLVKHQESPLLENSDVKEWDSYIISDGEYDIRLAADPGQGALCDYELKKLQEVADRYSEHDQWKMRELTHELPEYKDPDGSSKIIPLREFLRIVDMDEVADQVIADAEQSASLARLLGR